MEKRNWTNQEYFDEAVRYLASMDNQCATNRGTCLYFRKSDGSRCLVGHFISDSDIKMLTQGDNFDFDAGELVAFFPELSYLWPDESPLLAVNLQQIHDDAYHWNDNGLGKFRAWHKLEKLGREFNLDLKVLDEVKVM